MTYNHTNPSILLSALWIFIILNFFARDIHELIRPGMLEQIMSGTIDGAVVTEMLMLLGWLMIEIPIVMTILALLLPHGINRWAVTARLGPPAACGSRMLRDVSNDVPIDVSNVVGVACAVKFLDLSVDVGGVMTRSSRS